MPAVYGIDLIAKRDKKIKMDRSIVKCWNVHYQTLEEVEEETRRKKKKEAEEARKNAEQLAEEDEEDEEKSSSKQGAAKKGKTDAAYNRKTGAYSGHYGTIPVDDEEKKQQIHAILNEKPEPFESAMSAIQAQG
ncbi:MAG: hypothetical protein K2N87_13775 [Eubacterium sp.]|nr:hypothetical protein [Eubacterium sp.]